MNLGKARQKNTKQQIDIAYNSHETLQWETVYRNTGETNKMK